MTETKIAAQLLEQFDRLPSRPRVAARWMLDHPDDVALLSMREQAKRAGVPPATMTRLAQRLGFDGFDSLRAVYAASLRSRTDWFRGRTEEMLARRELDDDGALTSDLLAAITGHVRSLSAAPVLDAIAAAADVIVNAERLFCIGARSSFAGAHLGNYLLSLIGVRAILLDSAGATGLDLVRDIGPRDAMLALAIRPYTRVTVEAAAFATARGARLVAVTDSHTSPLARQSATTIIVPTSTPSFLQTVAPALIAVECIAALVAARLGRKAVDAISAAEAHFDHFRSYATEPTDRGSRP